MTRVPFVVLGGGVAGLAVGWELGERAVVLEREARPGGLVRTARRGAYWFDHVLHLLYFADAGTERRIRELLGGELAPCVPEAWVECRSGVARFPMQMNLGTLAPDAIVACLRDLAAATFGPRGAAPSSFEELLLATFGPAMCDELFLPYNRKVWKRPLGELAPTGFQWNITPPDFDEVVRGALSGRAFAAYNAGGFYPRPPENAPVRGMELLASRLAARVCDLRLEHDVTAIDLDERVVYANGRAFPYGRALVSTLPLPFVVACCVQAPPDLRARCDRLLRNRVVTVALAIAGPRPARGHWRYYADESLAFTRLVYLHEFDPALAPAAGFGVLAELTERAEDPRAPEAATIARVVADVARAGALPDGAEVVDAAVIASDPAYVVFDHAARATIDDARAFLAARDCHVVGRYGRWEYSSMAQVMRDGFALGAELRGAA